MGRPLKDPQGGKRHNGMFRMSEALRARLMAAADGAGRSMSEEIERRLEASFDALDTRLMIREEIRAALAADRAAQAEVSELLMRDTVETMRVGMAVAERRNFGPRPEAIYGCNGEPKASWKV